jgi:quinol monooxygenase YgiN
MVAYIVLEVHTKPDQLDAMRRMLTTNLPQALAFEGCISVDLVENVERPGNLLFFEKWRSRDDYQKYFDWRVSTGVLEAFSAMLDGEPSFRFFEAYETER